MAIDSRTFIQTSEFKGRSYGFALDDYDGKKSLVSVESGTDGKLYARWCYPQTGKKDDRKPADKCVPMKISLGDDMNQAADALRVIADMLDGGLENVGDDIQF